MLLRYRGRSSAHNRRKLVVFYTRLPGWVKVNRCSRAVRGCTPTCVERYHHVATGCIRHLQHRQHHTVGKLRTKIGTSTSEQTALPRLREARPRTRSRGGRGGGFRLRWGCHYTVCGTPRSAMARMASSCSFSSRVSNSPPC